MTAAPLPAYADVPVQLPEQRTSDLLRGAVAVVTGGGRGIGQAVATGLADAGAAVVLVGRHHEHLEAAAEVIERRGGSAAAEQADLSDPEQARGLVAGAERHFGRVTVLVNNAGLAAREAPGQGVPVQLFDQLFAVNVRAAYYAMLGAAEHLGPGSSIVNIASVTARVPDPELAAYAAGKAAVESLTRTFAVALGGRGIRVNAVAPGYLDSPLNHARKADPQRARAVVGRTPLGRWGLPADAADAVCFLASDRAGFITGQVLAVDGGFPAATQIAPQSADAEGHR